MLKELSIENIAIVKKECIEFDNGFSVLTGETGAGKSIIIDSIGLIMGARFSKELIRSGEENARVSALFTELTEHEKDFLENAGFPAEDDGTFFIQRKISVSGASSAIVNGRTVTVSVLRTIGEFLINIHGQHASQALLEEENHILYLDAMANDSSLLSEYSKIYEEYSETKNKIEELKKKENEKERTIELLKYQLNDIDSVKPKKGEEEALEINKKKIADAEKISKYSTLVYRALYRNEKGLSASELISKASDAISVLSDIIPDASSYVETLRDFAYRIEDIAETIHKECDVGYKNPSEILDRIESRLNSISKLKRKYGSTVEDIIAYREKIASELKSLEHSEETITDLSNDLKEIKNRLSEKAAKITEVRNIAAKELEERIVSELRFLEMEKVRFKISVTPLKEFSANGNDAVSFLVSANPGEPLLPLSKIASGGELSRTMLALKCALADNERTPTLIFDEIDTGVSGEIADKMGEIMAGMARYMQVIAITHLPQVASRGKTHYRIYKDEDGETTQTRIELLDDNRRVQEVARMLSGSQLTDAAMKNARELLNRK